VNQPYAYDVLRGYRDAIYEKLYTLAHAEERRRVGDDLGIPPDADEYNVDF
jgi:hypothetical protein